MVELTYRSKNNRIVTAGNEIPIDTKDIFGKYLMYMEGKKSDNLYQQNKRMREDNIWANEIEVKRSSFDNGINFISNAKHTG